MMRVHQYIHAKCRLLGLAGALFTGAAALMMAQPAHADTVTWANWSNSYTAGATGGSASATISATPLVNVSYSGEVESVVANYPSWEPTSTYVGGTISNAPPQSGGIVQLFGGSASGTDTINFSTAVTDPVMAIWSLGQGGDTAQFDFTSDEPFTIQAGGPSNEYGGATITQSGNDIFGAEGNGTIQFLGTYTSLSWTTPVFENWYGFTVGIEGVATTSVPLPNPLAMLGVGMAGLMAWRMKKSFRLSQTA